MTTHLAVAATALGVLGEIQVVTEAPGPGEVLVEIEYSTITPPDVYTTDIGFFFVQSYPARLGMNAAGTVVEVGPDVPDLVVGDKVIAFAYQSQAAKALQKFAVFNRIVVGKVPNGIPLHFAVTLPDNFVTAFWLLFDNLKLPLPESFPATTQPPLADVPILVYGTGSSVGQYTVQLLRLAGYKQIYAAASPKHHAFLRTLGAAHTFDYSDPEILTAQILNIAGSPVTIAIDPIATETSLAAVSTVVGPGSKVAVLLPFKEGSNVTPLPGKHMSVETPDNVKSMFKDIELLLVNAFSYLSNTTFGASLMPEILPQLLSSGAIQPNCVRLLDQGSLMERVEVALDLVRHNNVSGERVVVQISSINGTRGEL